MLCSLCLYGVRSQAQDRLRGAVSSLSSETSAIHVLNTSRHKATITDANGRFEIPASEGDSVVFSGVQFYRETIVVTADMLTNPDFTVYLREKVTELDEVVLRNLTGNLTTDMRRIKTDSVTSFSLGLPNAHKVPLPKTERKLLEATTGGGFIPLNPVINAITGRTKRLKKYVRLERENKAMEEIRQRVGDHFFDEMGIPEVHISDFLFYCQARPVFGYLKDNPDIMAVTDSLRIYAEKYLEDQEADAD
ncbi:hypothetical protein DN748_11690 [Sinomicrobium soli]|nr:hypothetical protein DN748_11690 [Sinomicrobium sp. N-1-3-6]